MRLLDTKTLQFKEFVEDKIPPYAILSHTWASPSKEVSFQDMALKPKVLMRNRKHGYSKIVKTCHLASKAGLSYAWIDSCCIDKTSSAELTEAINSMFRWYEKATVCYIHLADVKPGMDLETGLRQCRWITRGWTLQELIAPGECKIYDSEWKYRGRKTRLREMLAGLTGVPAPVLAKEKPPADYTVGRRMSWAAARRTTRAEDLAYCLLGIFGIHMPMIYGEGEMAFYRLQEEIIRRTWDPTILAWDPPDGAPALVGILAPSPACFKAPQAFMNPFPSHPEAFTLTKEGIKIGHNCVLRSREGRKGEDYVLRVGNGETHHGFAGIFLRKVDVDIFCRLNRPVMAGPQSQDWPKAKVADICVADFRTSPVTHDMILDSRRSAVQIVPRAGFEFAHVQPRGLWDQEDRCFMTGSQGATMVQWVEIAGVLLNHVVELVVFLRRSAADDFSTPVVSIFDKQQFEQHFNYLLQHGREDDGCHLTPEMIKADMPSLLSHTDYTYIFIEGVVVEVLVSMEKTMVTIREGDVEMYQAKLKFDVVQP